MPLEVSTLRDQQEAEKEQVATYKLTQRTCLDSTQTRVVDCNSSEAHYQLGNAGKEIPEARAKELGLLGEEKQDEAEDKQLKSEAEDKSAKPATRTSKTTRKRS